MHAVAPHLAEYLNETLGVSLSPGPWTDTTRLPPFLGHRYRFLRAELFDRPILFMVDEASNEEAPTTIRKHVAQVRTKWDHLVVYVRERVTAYNRKRLIQHRVPFVVPGNQMYIPELALDLREYFRKPRGERSTFSPSTQAAFIYALLRGSNEPLVATDLAPELGYTTMTMSRAFDEIESADLAASESTGRERCLRFAASRRKVWKQAQPLLRCPVKRRHYIRHAPENTLGPRAGLSALARYTMIAGPKNGVFAVSREHWKSLQQRRTVQELSLREPEALEIEVWSYPPKPYHDDAVVDPLSLYLSLRDTTDERVESALEHMMGGLPW